MPIDEDRSNTVDEELHRARALVELGGTTADGTPYRHLRRLAAKVLSPLIARQHGVNLALLRAVDELHAQLAETHVAIDVSTTELDWTMGRSAHRATAETADATGWSTANEVDLRVALVDLERRVDALDGALPPSDVPTRPIATGRRGEGLSVTVHGNFDGFNGVSAASRRLVADLHHAGVAVFLADFASHTRSAPELLDEVYANLPRSNEPDIHLWTQNTVELNLVDDADLHPEGKGQYNVATWWWEMPSLPDRLAAQARRMDELWVASPTIRSALFGATDAPVQVLQQSLRPFTATASRAEVLEARGLRTDLPTFLCSFDAQSVPARKNPDGAVAAFAQAFGRAGIEAQLIVKAHGLSAIEPYEAYLRDLVEGVGGLLVDEALSDRDFTDLMAAADVYVSLHRAEGLGLGMAEAMSLGIPVIATGFSGNRVFLDHASGCLVGFTVRAVTEADVFYNPGLLDVYTAELLWAEPDLTQAARWMRLLADDPTLRARIGAAGKAAVDYRFNQDRTAGAMVDRLWAIHHALERATTPTT